MRRTASEVLQSLEVRVARLERLGGATLDGIEGILKASLNGVKVRQVRNPRPRISLTSPYWKATVKVEGGSYVITFWGKSPIKTEEPLKSLKGLEKLDAFLASHGGLVEMPLKGLQEVTPLAPDNGVNAWSIFKSILSSKYGRDVGADLQHDLGLRLEAVGVSFRPSNDGSVVYVQPRAFGRVRGVSSGGGVVSVVKRFADIYDSII